VASKTIRLTTAEALVRFLIAQRTIVDGANVPLFPGVSQHNQLSRIVEMLGQPPDSLIEGKNGFKYFTKVNLSSKKEVDEIRITSTSDTNDIVLQFFELGDVNKPITKLVTVDF
jgi:hypothetical protein